MGERPPRTAAHVKPRTDPQQRPPDVAGQPASDARASQSGRPRASARKVRLEILSSLLSDDSPTVWEEVRREFEKTGPGGIPTLRRAAGSRDPSVRSRARTILLDLEKRRAIRRLLRYAMREDIDLERALFLLARYHTPHLDPRPYQRALDRMGAEVLRRGRAKKSEMDRAMMLSEYLGGELDFGGSLSDFHHPDNIHVHRAIERRAGMPLTLSAIYMFVARRAEIRTAVLPLPGHVMLRVYGGERSIIIDPYHKGHPRSERECKKYLDHNGLPFNAAWLRDAPAAILLRRQLMNLQKSAQMRGLKREVRELSQVGRALEPRSSASQPSR